MTDDLQLPVDLRNPGEFYGSCGVLEVAARLDGEAVGWFEGGTFALRAPMGGRALFERIVGGLVAGGEIEIDPEDPESDDPAIVPLVIRTPFEMRLDWWLDLRGGTSELKTWAGQMKVVTIVENLREQIRGSDLWPSPFDHTAPLPGRFGFDTRAAWTALDVGFSPDKQDMKVEASPLVEMLGVLGLQRFRPYDEGDALGYVAWSEPSPPCVAMLRASGCIPTRGAAFSFGFGRRGKVKYFTPAIERRQTA